MCLNDSDEPYVGVADCVREIKIRHQDAGRSQHAASHNEHHHQRLGSLDQTSVALDNEDGDCNERPREVTQQRQEQEQGLAQYDRKGNGRVCMRGALRNSTRPEVVNSYKIWSTIMCVMSARDAKKRYLK